jgi:hypothetical protein
MGNELLQSFLIITNQNVKADINRGIEVNYNNIDKYIENTKKFLNVTPLTKWPLAKFIDEQRVFNEQGELLSYATVVIGVINSITRKPARVPKTVLEKLVPYYQKEDQIGL